jgi:hypothetical protein
MVSSDFIKLPPNCQFRREEAAKFQGSAQGAGGRERRSAKRIDVGSAMIYALRICQTEFRKSREKFKKAKLLRGKTIKSFFCSHEYLFKHLTRSEKQSF